jgi:hypothetical protein
MARKLKLTVVVGGKVYPAGSEPSSAVAKQISNPDAWEGEPDADEAVAPKKAAAPRKRRATTKASAEAKPPAESASEEPPRGGEGATEEAWRAHAAAVGVEVPEDAGRDDIIALVDARDSGK